MLHFDANPITIEYLVTLITSNLLLLKQYKTKEFRTFLCQYLQNNISDIRIIPLDHVTYYDITSTIEFD